ncbi:glutathione S-transferase N-terminal domain-containing protein [Sinimarinibacterium thermocellulolyticum]|uniref:Glutathione S-transferase N-terminal domain-containing protein n=1 Tax=Sinimarinibacterium thermocellulolyticum TaxID=3170016 RepID=A0ABV2A650_9GAMM
MTQTLTIIGNEGSPYSRKLRAVLRYRRIAHVWVVSNGPEYVAPPPVPVPVIPVLVWHDETGAMREAAVDSTPLIARLEREHTGRSLLPSDPALAFLSALVEDYGDEWCTKFMFHYRWTDPDGIEWARRQLMRQIDPSVPTAQLEQFAQWFGERQIARRAVVGCSEATAPLLEAGYRRLLGVLETLFAQRRFLFGDRPAAGDFGLYGQLTQLCGFDPTSARLAERTAPRVVAWTVRMEDLGGWRVDDGQWLDRDTAVDALKPLLAEIGGTYVPFLLANAAARARGAEWVECAVEGGQWRQQPFAYQVKCLNALRAQLAALAPADRDWLASVLAGSGCEALLAP